MSADAPVPGPGRTVVLTKLRPPRIRAAAPPRERLLQHVDDGGLRVVVVAAPAGFGKSTLLAHWAARSRRAVAWVSLDEGDNAVERFWLHLVESVRAVVPGFADRAVAALRSPRTPTSDALATELVNALAGVDAGVVMVLDDYHAIDHPELHAGVAFLVDHLPEGVTLVLASRTAPPLPLARLRGRGEVLDLGSEPLRATLDEATAFLTRGMGLALAPEAVSRLLDRTEGWFAGLQLAALALRGREGDAGALLEFGADHRLVLGYLTEEVVRGLDDGMRTFLLESSVLRRMTPAACDAVLGRNDGADMLRRVDDANLFVFAVEGASDSYRYHALFRAWLRRRLDETDPGRARALEARAASWCAAEGDTAGAIAHLLAADDAKGAAGLVVEVAVPALQEGRVEALRGWLAALPEAEVAARGRLALACAWCEFVAGDLRGIARWLEIAEAADLDPEAAAEAVALRAQVVGAQGRTDEAVRLARVALAGLGAGSAWVRGNLWLGLGAALHRAGEVVDAGDASRWGVADARLALARLSRRLDPRPPVADVGVHATAVVAPTARLGARVAIGPLACVGDDVVLGDDVAIGPGCAIGAGARIGAGTVLRERVVVADGVAIGARCLLQAGAVIGSDGFGYAAGPRGAERIHHLGTVVLGDDVDVGANACIDRATLGATRVGDRSRIDNLVQLGHNVRVGRDVLIAGQAGIAGSTVIGDGVVIGGAAGVADHVRVGDGARIAGGAGVTKSVPDGEAWGGYPAQSVARWARERYLIGRLEAIWAFVKGRA